MAGQQVDEQPPQARVDGAPIQVVYFNGFEVGTTLSDAGAILTLDGHRQVKLSMSFTTAKTFAQQLNKTIEQFESTTKNKLLTMGEVEAAYGALDK